MISCSFLYKEFKRLLKGDWERTRLPEKSERLGALFNNLSSVVLQSVPGILFQIPFLLVDQDQGQIRW